MSALPVRGDVGVTLAGEHRALAGVGIMVALSALTSLLVSVVNGSGPLPWGQVISGAMVLIGALMVVAIAFRLSRRVKRDVAEPLKQVAASWDDLTRSVAASNAEKEKLHAELDVARKIQDSMLPQKLKAEGLDVAARTIAAEEVGGDYYDVLPAPGGSWIGIGDVAGHGLPAGIIMLTVQSAISALTKQRPDATPKEILGPLNRVIHENVHDRLDVNDYVTLSLMRFFHDGRIVVAGAHEDVIVFRAAEGKCETWPTEGTWIGVIDDIDEFTTEATYHLQHGDTMVLFTDGFTEATDTKNLPFGFERLVAEVEKFGYLPVAKIVDKLIDALRDFAPRLHDDVSIVVLRYQAPGKPRAATIMSPAVKLNL